MLVTDLTVEIRDANLNRVGQLTPEDLSGFTMVMRYNNVGTWSLTLPASNRYVDLLRSPGYGIIVTYNDNVILSGPTTSAKLEQSTDNIVGDWVIDGADDSLILSERLAYPTPTTSDVAQQSTAYDAREGSAESVVKAYVAANIGQGCGTDRAIDYLEIEPDLARGSNVIGNARFETLQELIYPLAQTGGIGYTIEQVGDGLVFQVYEPVDRTASIRMDLENGRLTSTEYAYLSPKATRVIVGGEGEAALRVFYEGSSTESILAENVWGRRIEHFADSRSGNAGDELVQTANEMLVDNGKTIVNLNVTPSDDQTMRFGYDWFLGDRVTVVAGNVESSSVVTEIGLSVQPDGVRIGATVGTPAAIDFEAKLAENQKDQEARISNLERNEPALVATTIKQLINNRTGSTILKGQAVYISGAQGNRVTVALAKADTELTSSKTFGIAEADILNNQSGYILTEGSLTGLNTSAMSEGQAAWLSSTVAGGWSGTKPSAPNHLVLIGFCERAHAQNGSIFVKVQNGFELEELHNVKITSPTDGQFLKYQASTGLWVNSN